MHALTYFIYAWLPSTSSNSSSSSCASTFATSPTRNSLAAKELFNLVHWSKPTAPLSNQTVGPRSSFEVKGALLRPLLKSLESLVRVEDFIVLLTIAKHS